MVARFDDVPGCQRALSLAELAMSLRAQSRSICADFASDVARYADVRRRAADLCRDARLLRDAVERQEERLTDSQLPGSAGQL